MPLIRTMPGRVWRVTLARPDARNALTEAMLADLRRALAEAAVDPEARAVVVDAEGEDFCAGADLRELEEAVSGPAAESYGRALDETLTAVVEHPLPVIAAAQGAALGGGCQLLLAADLAVASADARIGVPSARLGVVMAFPSIARLVAAVGEKRAAAILLAARAMTGEAAAAAGLVTEAVPAADLAGRATQLADEVAAGAPLSIRASKRGIRLAGARGDRGEFDPLAAAAFASEDLHEGIRAFHERRAPRFRGR